MWTRRITFFILATCFLAFTFHVYTNGTGKAVLSEVMSHEATLGKEIWNKSNCIACHQIYGSGGYMGPDLTNVISAKGKGEMYAKILIKTGTKRMPNFNLTDDEVGFVVEFLKHVDRSGIYPNKEFVAGWFGDISLKEK
jgi:nitric oxide reductase subunit C